MATTPEASTLDHTIPLRIDSPTLREVKAAGDHLHMSDQQTMRLALGIGLEVLRAIDHDLQGTIANRFLRQATGKAKRRK